MPLELAANTLPRRLDLGCGQTPKEGFEAVDLNAEKVDHRVDLFRFPFPWEDASIDEIYCSHFVEHLPARDVEGRDTIDPKFVGRDFFFAFFDECWRVLKGGASMKVIVPSGRSDRAYQDPTHRRFIVAETFGYLDSSVRNAMGLSHYRVKCDFSVLVTPTVLPDLNLRHPEVQAQKFREAYNVVGDWHATLIAKK